MAFSVVPSRPISSPRSSTGIRRCSDRPSVMASTSFTMRSIGRSRRPASVHAVIAEISRMIGAMTSEKNSTCAPATSMGSVERPATTRRTTDDDGRLESRDEQELRRSVVEVHERRPPSRSRGMQRW